MNGEPRYSQTVKNHSARKKWKGGLIQNPPYEFNDSGSDLVTNVADGLPHVHYRSSIILLAFPSLRTIVLGCNMDTGTFMPITC